MLRRLQACDERLRCRLFLSLCTFTISCFGCALLGMVRVCCREERLEGLSLTVVSIGSISALPSATARTTTTTPASATATATSASASSGIWHSNLRHWGSALVTFWMFKVAILAARAISLQPKFAYLVGPQLLPQLQFVGCKMQLSLVRTLRVFFPASISVASPASRGYHAVRVYIVWDCFMLSRIKSDCICLMSSCLRAAGWHLRAEPCAISILCRVCRNACALDCFIAQCFVIRRGVQV